MRWLALALVAVIIVSVTWWSTGHRTAAKPASPVTDTQPVDAAAAPTRHGALLPPADPAEAIQARHAAAQARIAKDAEIGHSRLLAQFQNEKVDGAWASAREQSLAQSSISPQITELKAQPKNMHSQCRSSMCRVTADFDTRSTADDWVTLFLTNTGTNLSRASYHATPNPDGTVHVEIYGTARD